MVLTSLAGTTGCAVEPDTNVRSGDAGSDSFKELRKYYELHLPEDVSDLEWSEVTDWDSNQLYLHMSADADGAETVLASYSVHLQDAQAYRDGLCRAALPRSSGAADQLPDDVARWRPSSGVAVRCGSGHGFGLLSAEVLVVVTSAQARELFLHVSK